jgi:hypothetical protein
MKKIITILLITVGLTAFSQTTINPDTVCANAIGEIHFVTNTPGSTYQWTITGGGTLTNGQGTNSITTDWGSTSGLYPNAVSVLETSSSGCLGIPVNLDVYILDLNVSSLPAFCLNDNAQTLSATPSGGVWSGNGVVGNDFDPFTAGIGTHVITYSLGGCTNTINVIVNNSPITGPIQHY